jgi:iron(III) transport system ATP-binding protein
MITIRGLTRDFRTADRALPALAHIDLEVADEEFLVLLGPSGSGKTTLLRCVAGLERPDAGEIALGGETVFSAERGLFTPPEHRRLGMVFQSYAVWPHLTVRQNVALPLTRGANRIPRSELDARIAGVLSAVQLEALADRPTTMLSGGQQQRVALARAMAIEPRALLMDEPLSNLDARLREEIRAEIKATVKAIGVTVLYVTHDQAEAMALADRIAVMDAGRIVQIGSADELYRRPATPHVAEFFGSMNWIAGTVRERGTVETSFGTVVVPAAQALGAVVVGIRPEDLRLVPADGTAPNALTGQLVDQVFFGDHRLCRVRALETIFTVKVTGAATDGGFASPTVQLSLPQEKLHVFATSTDDG